MYTKIGNTIDINTTASGLLGASAQPSVISGPGVTVQQPGLSALLQPPAVLDQVIAQRSVTSSGCGPVLQQAAPLPDRAGVYCFVSDSTQKQRVIDQCRRLGEVCSIQAADDLNKNGIAHQVCLLNGELRSGSGRLFTDQPLTLIVDLTLMSPGEIAGLNDLLQPTPAFNGQPLGAHVSCVFLINNTMLRGTCNGNPDLWRRLGQMSELMLTADGVEPVTDEQLLGRITTGHPGTSVVTIDFSASGDWRSQLFGAITVNEQGQLDFAAGALANLGAGTHLDLKEAPWNDVHFVHTLASALRAEGFQANGQWVPLPGNITLSRSTASESELAALKSEVIASNSLFDPAQPFVCLNATGIESLKGELRVNGNQIMRANRLAILLDQCQHLVLTGDLARKEWLWLLAQLPTLACLPKVFVDVSAQSLLGSGRWQVADSAGSNVNGQVFSYAVNATDSRDSLQQVGLVSQQQFTFTMMYSPLMHCLINGTPVTLSGLENNRELAAILETLLLPVPYLLLNGHRIFLPRICLTLIRPATASTGSLLFDHIFGSTLPPSPVTSQNPVYGLLQQLPRSPDRSYPDTPPWSTSDFQQRFERQCEVERECDGALWQTPYHQRRALHFLLAKCYRGNPEVYSFIKAKIAQFYPDRPAEDRADQSGLRQWLAENPGADRAALRQSFWTLARHCPVALHQSVAGLNHIDSDTLDRLAHWLIGATESSERPGLAQQFEVLPAPQQSYYDGVQLSLLHDTLIGARVMLKPGTIISENVRRLAHTLNVSPYDSHPDQVKRDYITSHLATCFVDQLPADDLSATLLAGQRHTSARQARRLTRLADRIREYPIIFIQGEAGIGKTYTAQAVVAEAGYAHSELLHLGPGQTAELLYGGQQLVPGPDPHSEFVPGPLLQWAANPTPPLLVLDDANMAPEGLLSPLAGLLCSEPQIHFRGQCFKLTKNHRIILLGNPDCYTGRQLDGALSGQIPTLIYKPMSSQMLASEIILPGLPAQWTDALKQQACDRIITLFNHYHDLAELVTLRDIKDVLAIMRQLLAHRSKDASEPPTPAQVSALVRRAFTDSLAAGIAPEQQHRLRTLNIWYQGLYSEDATILKPADQDFETFLKQLQVSNRDGDFTPPAIRRLVYCYWQALDKDDHGRRAVLVAGPAGWGKDFVLERAVRMWQQLEKKRSRAFVHVNASPEQWDVLVTKLKQAMSLGQWIGVSELNIIPGYLVEELFNEALTGEAVSGFRLFATVNPNSFEGREVLSPALKNRCTQVRLDALGRDDLQKMVERLPNIPHDLPGWLASHFDRLNDALAADHSPIQLALDDLFSSARHLTGCPRQQWWQAWQQHLSLPFRALSSSLPPERQSQGDEPRRLAIEEIANRVPGLSAPVSVTLGAISRASARGITVPAKATDDEVEALVRKVERCRCNNQRSANPVDTSQPEKTTVFTFGDILGISHLTVTRYFPQSPYREDYYRLCLLETRLDEDGELRSTPIRWQDGPVSPFNRAIPWRTQLREDELPGKVSLELHNDWQPLPGLSPADQLRALQTTPRVAVSLARSGTTGQLLIRQQQGVRVSVAVDFIIAPKEDYFLTMRFGQLVHIDQSLCNSRLMMLLNNKVFSPGTPYDELRAINGIAWYPDRLAALVRWLDTFSDDENVTGQGDQLLLDMLRKKQGVCRHKAMIFQILCHYWGIPARQVLNDLHQFVEVSPDRGRTWQQYQIGGGVCRRVSVTEPDWGGYQQPATSSHVPVSERDGSDTSSGKLSRELESILPLLLSKNLTPGAKVELSQRVKSYLSKLNNVLQKSCSPILPKYWEMFLSPGFFSYFADDVKSWSKIILTNAWSLVNNRDLKVSSFTNRHNTLIALLDLTPRELINEEYLNWLCHLCESGPYIFQYFLLGVLQKLCSNYYCSGALKNRVSQLQASFTLHSQPLRSDESCQDLSPICRPLVKKLARSRHLCDRVTQRTARQRFHHQPREGTIFVPERLLSRQPPFSSTTVYKISKPIIFDVSAFDQCVMTTKIEEQLSLGIKPHIRSVLLDKGYESPVNWLFLFWLADHSDGVQIWLGDHYEQYTMGLLPTVHDHLMTKDKMMDVKLLLPLEHLKRLVDQSTHSRYLNHIAGYKPKNMVSELPPDQIRKYFNQPEAVVVQSSELESLLDEFLVIIAE